MNTPDCRSSAAAKPVAEGQSSYESLMESALNALIGYLTALMAQTLILPAYDVHISARAHLMLALWMTSISLMRSYCFRRYFNRLSRKGQSKKSSFVEAVINMLAGYGVAVASHIVFMQVQGVSISMGAHLSIGGWMAVVSVIRSYLLRRFFNGRLLSKPVKA